MSPSIPSPVDSRSPASYADAVYFWDRWVVCPLWIGRFVRLIWVSWEDCTKTPLMDNNVSWRGNSCLQDGKGELGNFHSDDGMMGNFHRTTTYCGEDLASLKGGINQAGIKYYNNLINALLSKGIKPFVTIFHWDTPQALEDAYGGFRGAEIVDDFRDYAELCFNTFGDRVKHWITLNEPLTVVQQGYVAGAMAPGRCSKFTNPNCTGGDGATEPYIVGHNLILSHGAAVKVYREKYMESQKGQVGIALNAGWNLPYTESREDRLAAARAMAFTFDYFMEPLVTCNYPVDMVNYVKDGRLPTFTAEQSKMLTQRMFLALLKMLPCSLILVPVSQEQHCSGVSIARSMILVTASVDRIIMKRPIRVDTDLSIVGAVTWVGRSSMEMQLQVIQSQELWLELPTK